MKTRTNTIRSLALGLAGMFLTGCLSGTYTVSNIIPTAMPSPAIQFSKTIHVAEVRGAPPSVRGGLPMLSNQDFFSALDQTLRGSQIFSDVLSEGPSDLSIKAKFVVSTIEVQGLVDYESVMVIEYQIYDMETNALVWSKGFNSRELRKDTFSHGKRAVLAQETSAKKNLTQMLTALANADLD